METWCLILTTLCISALLKPILNLLIFPPKHSLTLPPGPPNIPIISGLLLLSKSPYEIEQVLRSLLAKFGPMLTLRLGPRPAIFVSDLSLAHKALVQNGAVFADRPPPSTVDNIVVTNNHSVTSSHYGPNWRALRRNLTAEILSSSRVKSYAHARKWVLHILLCGVEEEAKTKGLVIVRKHFEYAMFCLLVLMCFGDKLGEEDVKKIVKVERDLLLNVGSFAILNFFVGLSKILLYKRWKYLFQLRKNQEDVLLPLVRQRRKVIEGKLKNDDYVLCYADTLLNLELPEEKRKLNEFEMVSLCNEFLSAGVDTSTTALQWIMANLVKYPEIQKKLFNEINGVAKGGEILEEDLPKMPYLKAVVLEGLRRHPPVHFLLPHAVSEDTTLDKYLVPKDGTINFMVAEMGRDPKVWNDPMEFKPERFLDDGGEGFDITGSREIKMMPFGAGRRMCPGYALAMLHLEYFVANLVCRFEWKAVEGDDIDLSEKQEFTVVMKNPLRAQISKRFPK